MSKVKPAATQAKNQAPAAPAKATFDGKAYAKNGVTEEDVNAAKTAFDLFDSDAGGSVDIKGTSLSKRRTQSRHDLLGIRV
jgi:hypothetical protein